VRVEFDLSAANKTMPPSAPILVSAFSVNEMKLK
jgi:hypothetical protein